MATQAHAPLGPGLQRYRRAARFPIIGANISGQVSLVTGDKDIVILGTIAAFGIHGSQTLTTNFGPIIPVAGVGNFVGLTTPTAAMPTTAATVNGAPMGSTLHNVPTAATGFTTGLTPPTASTAPIVNGAATGPTFFTAPAHSTVNGVATAYTAATASNHLTINGVASGPTPSTASTISAVNGTPTGTTNPTASTALTTPTANGPINNTLFAFSPMTAQSNHGLPFELTDILISFKEFKGIFKCIKDVQSNTFTQIAIVTINKEMREALHIPLASTIAYPNAHMAGTLAFNFNESTLCFEISWLVDHKVDFMIKASTSPVPLW